MKLSIKELNMLDNILTSESEFLNSDIKRSKNEHIVNKAKQDKKIVFSIRRKVRADIKLELLKLKNEQTNINNR